MTEGFGKGGLRGDSAFFRGSFSFKNYSLEKPHNTVQSMCPL